MKPTLASETCATGVEGLDEILRGGLPSQRLYLLKGNPGVGKTTLALQYLIEGVRRGEPGLYITLSETRDEINSVARSHGWSLEGLAIFELSALEHQLAQESQNTVFRPSEIELNKTTDILLGRIDEVKPKRLVIDSLSELRLLSDTPLRYRRQMLSLKQFLSVRDVTVMLLDDHAADGGDLHVQSIAHGVITIEQLESDYGAERRRVKINKLRGINFAGGFHDAVIVEGGLKIFPRLVAAEHGVPFEAGIAQTEIPALDALVGGGLDRGTSCLLLGPAGTGKSTIALQFAVAAAQRGESVLLCLFEENARTLVARADSVNMPVKALVDSGLIEIRQVDPVELAPGEFVNMVQQRVQKDRVSMVIVDSLNGYLQAMPDVKFLNIQLHELLAFLSHHGVVTIMTVAQHGIVGQMNTPIDLTYLADTVMLLRYFEQEGRIRKAISVVKKRMGRHEDTIRELKMSNMGIRVGEPLEKFHGVLTGVPTFQGKAADMLPET
ncbi:MAG: circadian clock protein KaiC [Rariglobus sp.]|jgi:circadian clock protein KaiC|nr:circadian clock protein KaiC [Rariglobus sp.]